MSEKRRTALDVVRVESPCPVAWESMAGEEWVRFCEGCGRHVHNLSAMTTDEAERLVCEAAGRLCVRFERAPDGAVQTVDYRPQPPSKSRWARWGWPAWAAIGACGAAAATVAHLLWFGTSLVRPQQPMVTVGKIMPITTPVTPAPAQGKAATGSEVEHTSSSPEPLEELP